ncbi:MAG: GNAT family N-acetyltransferase [Nitrospirae bacterium]|nr:GNAT family N-acetyltransferase [Nitrospirota bacterium]
MYDVRIAGISEFKENKDIWNKLVSEMVFPNIFCTWEWVYTWWEHFGKDNQIILLFVYDGTELRGILPLYSHVEALSKDWMSGRILRYCASQELYPDHLDIICSQEESEQCVSAIFDFLTNEYTDWDILHLPRLIESSRFISFLSYTDTHMESPFDFEVKEASAAFYIPLAGSFEDYISAFNKKKRYNLRSRRKKLFEEHGVKYIPANLLQDTDVLNALFDLHDLRARRKNIKSTFARENIFNFHRDLIKRIAGKGWVSLRALRKDSEVIAASYNFIFEGCVFSYQKGFNPQWDSYGPGTVLLYELIQESFSEGHKEYNFLSGEEEYKKGWTNQGRTLFDIKIYNKTLRGNLSKRILESKNVIKNSLKRYIGHHSVI